MKNLKNAQSLMVIVKIRKILNLVALVTFTVVLCFVHFQYPHPYITKGLYTLISLTIIHFVFKSVLQEILSREIKDSKTRYSFRKAISILYLAVLFLVLVQIWIEDTEALLVTYGLVGAGVAVALQDFFKNFAGGIIIFLTRIYNVGDRIEVESVYGDVIDIGLFYTTLLELKRWIKGDQATGGLTIIPNGYILSKMINNYTKDNNFIWDEIEIPLTYDSSWKKAIVVFLDIVRTETESMVHQAEEELSQLRLKYFLSEKDVKPAAFVTLTDNWITLSIRYITEIRQRRKVRNTVGQKILEEIEKNEDITIASATVDIVGFPEQREK